MWLLPTSYLLYICHLFFLIVLPPLCKTKAHPSPKSCCGTCYQGVKSSRAISKKTFERWLKVVMFGIQIRCRVESRSDFASSMASSAVEALIWRECLEHEFFLLKVTDSFQPFPIVILKLSH